MTLTDKQIAEFKQRLLELRTQLTHKLEGEQEQVKKPDESKGYSQHQADEGTDDFDRTITIGLTAHDQTVLRQIDRALEKIQEGTYGICDVSQEPIPLKRLEAIPYAAMTVAAQQKLEQRRG